jgi:hypothetical protein
VSGLVALCCFECARLVLCAAAAVLCCCVSLGYAQGVLMPATATLCLCPAPIVQLPSCLQPRYCCIK